MNNTVGLFLAAAALIACSHHATPPPTSSGGGPLTYYKDVKPIVDAKCATCHADGGIAPFALTTADAVVQYAPLMKADLESGKMPPWPPDDSCHQYQGDRTLSASEKSTLLTWLDSSTKEVGDSKDAPTTPAAPTGLSRVDFNLKMPVAYTPQVSPDDYRCFLIDWPETTTKYLTGFGVHPGDQKIVHHAIAFLATPDRVQTYQQLDDADPGPGWQCFGGPGGPDDLGGFGWLGAWAPGDVGTDFPPGTGLEIPAGSKVILQVHYNTLSAPPAPDQTSLDIEVADSVQQRALVMAYADPSWILQHTMNIPANNPDVSHNLTVDITNYLSFATNGALMDGQAFTIYAASLHMHKRGSHASLSITHADGSNECLLSIPHWDFNWQGIYGFTEPVVFQPGDQLSLECHWNNSQAAQPIVNGMQVQSHELNWGEGTEDEMCLGIMYVTQ